MPLVIPLIALGALYVASRARMATDDIVIDEPITVTPTSTSLATTPLSWPVRDDAGGVVGVITQEYRPPSHMGVDVSIPGHYRDGVASVCAIADGVVTRAASDPRGHSVLIDHGDWASGYLHLSSLAVANGQHVSAGELLGPMGADPLDPEGVVHLHIQIAPGGNTVDPAPYLARAT